MNRADELRRQIALYRQQLADGVNGARAVSHLQEIKRLQAELDRMEKNDKRE